MIDMMKIVKNVVAQELANHARAQENAIGVPALEKRNNVLSSL